MMMFERMMEDFTLLEKSRTADGEGGFIVSWIEGATIKANATCDSSMQARIAEKEGVTSVWSITTSRDIKLDFHDVLKRVSDGKIFRITSEIDATVSPQFSNINLAKYQAERWELTQ